MAANPSHILALDVGSKRIGVALASHAARLARPLTTLEAGDDVITQLRQIIDDEAVSQLVIGLPRNLDGQDTDQTKYVHDFVSGLSVLELPIDMQDEALTSRKAEAELIARGKRFVKADIDALAATYILDDWLANHPAESL